MSWTKKEDVTWFVEQVRPPGEEPQGFDDRYSYEGAIEYAKMQGEDGRPLLEALQKRFGGERR